MLASIRFRGDPPLTPRRWAMIYGPSSRAGRSMRPDAKPDLTVPAFLARTARSARLCADLIDLAGATVPVNLEMVALLPQSHGSRSSAAGRDDRGGRETFRHPGAPGGCRGAAGPQLRACDLAHAPHTGWRWPGGGRHRSCLVEPDEKRIFPIRVRPMTAVHSGTWRLVAGRGRPAAVGSQCGYGGFRG